ncbi:MAG: KPN_02809 family neutral zinc metallopeptidase [Saccharofermentanales bacterium]
MKWQGRRTSTNVEDRRGSSGSRAVIGGGLGIGTIIIAIIIVLMGGNPGDLIPGILPTSTTQNESYVATSEEQELVEFVSVVLAETEDVWTALFEDAGMTYEKPKLVLYSGMVDSACGTSGSSTGPFYCPGDQKVYIDLSFFQELKTEFKAPGDFAIAYVIAHEIGHHVQYLMGTTEEVFGMKSKVSESEFNEYLVQLELQADYFSGVWAHYASRAELLEAGDLEEALTAASAVGDDRIQKQANGYVVPDSFTHGTSEQRSRWFKKGFTSGTIEDGDTFNAAELSLLQPAA